MRSSAESSPILFGSPFDAFSNGVASRDQTVLWRPGGDAVRRFSEPALGADKHRLAAHITSARTAYAEAYVLIRQCSKNVDVKTLLETSTAQDVAATAMDLARSEPAGQGKVSKFVEILEHYHGVFDVLSQADLSYLALIWGGMKLVLIVSYTAISCVVCVLTAL